MIMNPYRAPTTDAKRSSRAVLPRWIMPLVLFVAAFSFFVFCLVANASPRLETASFVFVVGSAVWLINRASDAAVTAVVEGPRGERAPYGKAERDEVDGE